MNQKNLEILDAPGEIKTALRNISMQDFRNFGLHQISYIRHVNPKGYVVYGADGAELSTAQTIEAAVIKAKQEHLEPVVVH